MLGGTGMTSIKNKYTTWTNKEKIAHLDEIRAEFEENSEAVHKLTRRSSDLSDEIAELTGEIVWD